MVLSLSDVALNCTVKTSMFEEDSGPDLLDAFAAIHLNKDNYENLGLVHAFYSGIYKNLVIYLEATEPERSCLTPGPLPQKTVCVVRKIGLAYGLYLMALGNDDVLCQPNETI